MVGHKTVDFNYRIAKPFEKMLQKFLEVRIPFKSLKLYFHHIAFLM